MMMIPRQSPIKILSKYFRFGIIIAILILTIVTLFNYKGNSYIYLIFSVVSNILLYIGFRKNAIFFDAFIGILFWLGFWLKLSIRVCFAQSAFHEAVGNFNGTGEAFDFSLWVTSCGMLGLILASFLRQKFIFNYPQDPCEFSHNNLLSFYAVNRNSVLISFVLLVLTIVFTNFYLGIYQRGQISRTTLPYGLNGIFKWLLLFGLASFSAVILKCEITIKKFSYLIVILSLLESFLTNISMLSRGMILNMSALGYGIYLSITKIPLKITTRFVLICTLTFLILFASSILIVNKIRVTGLQYGDAVKWLNVDGVTPLFIDRWVGIEGVMAVASSPSVGWDLWQEAIDERYSENKISFYDKNLIESPYADLDFTKHHYVSLPGILAFFFYPGSFYFLFVSMFLLSLIASLIEISAFRLGGNNLILCALISEVVAYRYANFGYVPAQSYLLFGAIFLNLFIIFFLNRLLGIWKLT